MITPKKIYEVFGITPGPWKIYKIKGYCIDHIVKDKLIVCDLNVPMAVEHYNSSLLATAPTMLVALVKVTLLTETEHDYVIKAIEAADHKKRPWSELKRELLS